MKDDKSIGSHLRRFLKYSGLDTLPQLFNVLSGQMSLVGPRTIPETEAHRFQRWLSNILTVKPGIAGVWTMQADLSLEDEIRANMYYIRNWTIWLDLQVLLHTLLHHGRQHRKTLLSIKDFGLDGLPYLDNELSKIKNRSDYTSCD
jgi:lipopolysaccharide/colanic/teichoic acid biosynthesis glycosyltransferase